MRQVGLRHALIRVARVKPCVNDGNGRN